MVAAVEGPVQAQEQGDLERGQALGHASENPLGGGALVADPAAATGYSSASEQANPPLGRLGLATATWRLPRTASAALWSRSRAQS